MFMTKKSIRTSYNFARALWGILIVVAILSRAVIPAGMMPDFKAQGQGIFKLTICSGDGMKTIDVPADTYNPAETTPEKHSPNPCPYAVSVNIANLVLAILIVLFLEVARVLLIAPPILRLSSKPLFANIYPRAPPHFS